MRAAPRKPAPYLIRGLPAYLLPALALLALAAALLWLQPADPAQAQDEPAGPKITAGPVITSSPESGDTYLQGEAITVALTFSEPVTVTGKPRVRLKIGDQKRWAGYAQSSDGATLSFTHAVKADDQDADGVSIGKNQLKLNKGTIEDADGNAANLKHPALPDQATHKVNGAPDEPEPEPTPTPTPEPEPANSAPQFADATAGRSVDENSPAGARVGARVTAEDADGDTLTYELTGSDAFTINDSGRIRVQGDLDYETQASHTVTVTAADPDGATDSIEVTISVVNVDEPGVVRLSTDTPQAGSALIATVTDPDGIVEGSVAWQWKRSPDGTTADNVDVTDFNDIAGATSASIQLIDADDAGRWLRALAIYTDAFGKTKARAQTANPVAPDPNRPAPQREAANAAPQFADATATRSVDENTPAGTSVGAPVVATDDDGDTLTYSLTGSDAFTIDASGQITVASGAALDYETQASHTVTVTVHDGKNAAGEADTGVDDSIAVTISVLNVNEPGVVSLLSERDPPQVGSELTAVVFDPDGGVSVVSWNWARSADQAAWETIAGATEAAYTPSEDDQSRYLQATVYYTDGHGPGKKAGGATVAPVEASPQLTSQPQNTGPWIRGVIITSDPGPDLTYRVGDVVAVTFTFSEAVAVTGTPQLEIELGTAKKTASCASVAAAARKLVCAYTVTAGDAAPHGIWVGHNKLTLPTGATIKNSADNDATLTYSGDRWSRHYVQTGFALDLIPAFISEDGGVSAVRATLGQAASANITITISATPVSPATTGDFSMSANRTLTIAAGETESSGLVTITAVDNSAFAANKTVTVSGTVTAGGQSNPANLTLTIAEDDYTCANTTATPSSASAGLVADCEALLASRDVLRGTAPLDPGSQDDYFFPLNWSTSLAIDSWEGVTVSGGRVSELFLSVGGNGWSSTENRYIFFDGGLPEQLGDLSELTDLQVKANKLEGPIPASLGNLSKLEAELTLQFNLLSGEIPGELGRLSKLKSLDLRDNRLSGSIPAALRGLASVNRLWLQNNRLSGTIPGALGDLEQLTDLRLSNNELTGRIPAGLGDMSSLEVLYLWENKLAGPIPAELGKLRNLRSLDLSDNRLEGPLPPELGNLYSLQYLYLRRNNLTGMIPAGYAGLYLSTYGDALGLEGNNLTGKVTLKVYPDHVAEQGGVETIVVVAILDKGTAWANGHYATSTQFDASSVMVSVNPGTATEGVDFTAVDDFEIAIPRGKRAARSTFILTPASDSAVETDGETIIVSATGRGGNSAAEITLAAANEPTVTILDGTRVPPDKPRGFVALKGVREVALTWDETGDGTVARYDLRQKQGDGAWGPWTEIPNSDVHTTGHTARNLEPGTIYAFQIRTANGDGVVSDPSDEQRAIPVSETETPDQVQELTVFRESVTGELMVSWRGVLGVSQYYLVINENSSGNKNRIYVPGDATSYTFKHTANVTGQRVGIRAINWDADPAWDSDPTADQMESQERNKGFKWFKFSLPLDSKPTATLTLTPSYVSEKYGVSELRAELSVPSSVWTRIDVSTNMGATGDYNYTFSNDRVLFIPPGSTASRGAVTITALPDIWAWDRSLTLSGTVNHRYVTAPDDVTLFVVNDDLGSCENSMAAPAGSPPHLVKSCEILLAAQGVLDGSGTPLTWSKTSDIASWTGVFLTREGFLRLSLYDGDSREGSIPAELGDLSFLDTLRLAGSENRKLSGPIPASLGNVTYLETLDLSGNNLTGRIPPELGNLTYLETLDLSNNKLTGRIPPELGRLANLETLDLSGNNLTGPIPAELGNLTNLTVLGLNDNALSGSVPRELYDLPLVQGWPTQAIQNNLLKGNPLLADIR